MATLVEESGKDWRSNGLVRLVTMGALMFAWLLGFNALCMPLFRRLGDAGSLSGDLARLAGMAIFVIGTLALYRALVRWFERRAAVELAVRPGMRLLAIGMAIGFLLFCACLGLMTLAGGVVGAEQGEVTFLIAQATTAMIATVAEEVLFRGILFRIVEQMTGTLVALAISASIFGLVHIMNPGATMISALAIGLQAGVLLALAYTMTRSLWFPIGIHFAWNFTQGGIFGASVSGVPAKGLIMMEFAGPDWLTGGVFGPESSALVVALCLVLALIFARRTLRGGEWRAVGWRLRLP